MKRFLISFLVVALQGVCLAGDADSQRIKVADNASGVTNSATSVKLTGYVEAIYIDVTAPATNTVVIASPDKTILTATGVTADTWYYPRYATCTDAGGAIASTNANHLLVAEPVTVTVTSTQTNVLDTFVIVKVRE